MADPFDLKLYTSATGAPGSFENCIGGAINVVLADEQILPSSTITGITFVGGLNLTPVFFGGSLPVLEYLVATQTVRWQQTGGTTFGSAVAIGADGRYFIPEDGDRPATDGSRLIIDVVAASLPVSNTSQNISTINTNDVQEALFGVVELSEQNSGAVKHRCFYVSNDHATDTIEQVSVYIVSQPVYPPHAGGVPDVFDLGLDPAGVGDGSTTGVATAIVDEFDIAGDLATAGVTFSAPTQAAPLVIGDLLPGQRQAVWFRTTVPQFGITEGVSQLTPVAQLGFGMVI